MHCISVTNTVCSKTDRVVKLWFPKQPTFGSLCCCCNFCFFFFLKGALVPTAHGSRFQNLQDFANLARKQHMLVCLTGSRRAGASVSLFCGRLGAFFEASRLPSHPFALQRTALMREAGGFKTQREGRQMRPLSPFHPLTSSARFPLVLQHPSL